MAGVQSDGMPEKVRMVVGQPAVVGPVIEVGPNRDDAFDPGGLHLLQPRPECPRADRGDRMAM